MRPAAWRRPRYDGGGDVDGDKGVPRRPSVVVVVMVLNALMVVGWGSVSSGGCDGKITDTFQNGERGAKRSRGEV